MVKALKEGLMWPKGVAEGATITVPYTPSSSWICKKVKFTCMKMASENVMLSDSLTECTRGGSRN